MEHAVEKLPDRPAKRPTGRPSKLTPDVLERLVEALRSGNTRAAAAEYAGIHRSQFYRWLERGEKAHRGKFRDFRDTVTRAENEAEMRCVAAIQKAANGWPVKKTTTKSAKKIIGTRDNGQPIYGTETSTTVVEYTEYDWRAALEWLQRRYPKQWGLRLRIEQMVEDELDEALDKLQAGLSPETYETVLALISEDGKR